MKDKYFIDTNIFVYSVLIEPNDTAKRTISLNLLDSFDKEELFISVQVLSEIFAALSKHKIGDEIIIEKLNHLIEEVNTTNINLVTIKSCWEIKKKYKYSYWDSLIIASALESNCSILFTEDLANGQNIDKKLKIVNPFNIK